MLLLASVFIYLDYWDRSKILTMDAKVGKVRKFKEQLESPLLGFAFRFLPTLQWSICWAIFFGSVVWRISSCFSSSSSLMIVKLEHESFTTLRTQGKITAFSEEQKSERKSGSKNDEDDNDWELWRWPPSSGVVVSGELAGPTPIWLASGRWSEPRRTSILGLSTKDQITFIEQK